MCNCHHFLLSLQFLPLFIRFAQPHTPEPNGVSRTRKKFTEPDKQRQNPISRNAFPSGIDFKRMRFADYRYNRKSRLLRCRFSMHSEPAEGLYLIEMRPVNSADRTDKVSRQVFIGFNHIAAHVALEFTHFLFGGY